jgi:hypothetical protein
MTSLSLGLALGLVIVLSFVVSLSLVIVLASSIVCLGLLRSGSFLFGISTVGLASLALIASLCFIRLIVRLGSIILGVIFRFILGLSFVVFGFRVAVLLGWLVFFAFLLLRGRSVLHLLIFLFRLGRLVVLLVLFLALFLVGLRVLLRLAVRTALSLLVDLKLRGALDDIVAGSLDVNGWIVRLGVLFDCVTTVGLDGNLALLFDLGNLATGLS